MSLSKIKRQKQFVKSKLIQNTLLTLFFVVLAVCVYFLLDDGNKTAWVFVCGISSVFSAAIIPHYIKAYMSLNERCRIVNNSIVIKDQSDKIVDSYSSLEELKKENPGMLTDHHLINRYTIEDIETQTIIGEIEHEEIHKWKLRD